MNLDDHKLVPQTQVVPGESNTGGVCEGCVFTKGPGRVSHPGCPRNERDNLRCTSERPSEGAGNSYIFIRRAATLGGTASTGAVSNEACAVTAGGKASNPKQMVGDTKAPLHLVPDSLTLLSSQAFAEGALKYGAFNWRAAGVQASTYKAAAERHIKKWFNGENRDPDSQVHHLANAIACLAIIADAEVSGMLNDDRPPKQDMGKLIAETEATLAHLRAAHAARNPKHWTALNINEAE